MKIGFSLGKLLLDLLVIACLVIAGWIGYRLFVLHELTPVTGSIALIADIGVLIWGISALRSSRYIWKAPSFKFVFFSLLGIVLILAFAGIQPLASYKDKVLLLIPSGESSALLQETLAIPCGTYIYTLGAQGEAITLNRDSTYEATSSTYPFMLSFRNASSTDRGTYEADSNFLYITSGVTGCTAKYRYRYSNEFKCLYIYSSHYGQNPGAFYKK